MARLVPFSQLFEGGLFFQECKLGSAIIPARIVEEIDYTKTKMTIGQECPFTTVIKDTSIFRYWDAIPTAKERKAAAW